MFHDGSKKTVTTKSAACYEVDRPPYCIFNA